MLKCLSFQLLHGLFPAYLHLSTRRVSHSLHHIYRIVKTKYSFIMYNYLKLDQTENISLKLTLRLLIKIANFNLPKLI